MNDYCNKPPQLPINLPPPLIDSLHTDPLGDLPEVQGQLLDKDQYKIMNSKMPNLESGILSSICQWIYIAIVLWC